MLSNLVDSSNNFLRGLKTKRFIVEKELKYFTYEYKKACNLRFQMKSWFLKKGYPEKLIENKMRKVKFGKKGIKRDKGVKGIPFVVTYHPHLKI